MALIEFKDGRPVEGSLEGVEVVEIPEGVEKIAERAFEGQTKIREIIIPDTVKNIENCAFRHCESLEKLYIPDSVANKCERSLIYGAFTHCKNLKEVRLPYMNRVARHMFFDCRNLEKVDLSAGVNVIEERTFSNCPNLKEVNLGEKSKVYSIAGNAFEGCPEDLQIKYAGISMPYKHLAFARSLSDGLTLDKNFTVLQKAHDILQDETFSPILVKKLCNAEHAGKLDDTAEKIKKSFQTIGFYNISDDVDIEAKEKLIELFKNNSASRGVVPRIIDALTIASTTLNIQPEDLVKSFENKKFRDAIIAMRTCHEGNHFFDVEAALFAMTFDVNTVKQFILENPYKDYASVLLCKGYKTDDEKFLNLAKWIAYHPDSNREMIEKLYDSQDYIDIRPDMTVNQVRAQVSYGEGELEIHRIEDQYNGRFSFWNCVCNLPKTEVELGRYRAYIMDGQDPRQVMLGYDTNCCQHLNGAGETAMMYGLANPDAGFFVIEDKETGKILAQAETWECAPEYRSVRTEEINLQTVFNDDINLANQLYRGVENYIEEGYCTDRWGSSEYADDYLTEELGFESWEIVDDKKAYGPVEGDDENIVAIVDHNDSVEILNLSLIIEKITRESRLIKSFNEYAVHGMELTADGELYKIECRKNDDKILVFDNIEFADDRQINQFAPILGKWCEASPYHDVIMGDGWNAMDNRKINHTNGVEPPVDGKMVWLMDKDSIIDCSKDMLSDQYSSSDLIYEAIANKELDLEEYGIYGSDDCCISSADFLPYTDADESYSVLKSEGKVEPYFKDALEEYVSNQKENEQSAQDKHKSRGR